MSTNVTAMTAWADQNVFHEGTAAFYDTFSGLIPCKVVSIVEKCYGFRCGPYRTVTIKLTADRRGYKRGEVLTVSASCVPPQKMIRRLKYSSRIMTNYSYAPKTPAGKP